MAALDAETGLLVRRNMLGTATASALLRGVRRSRGERKRRTGGGVSGVGTGSMGDGGPSGPGARGHLDRCNTITFVWGAFTRSLLCRQRPWSVSLGISGSFNPPRLSKQSRRVSVVLSTV